MIAAALAPENDPTMPVSDVLVRQSAAEAAGLESVVKLGAVERASKAGQVTVVVDKSCCCAAITPERDFGEPC